MIGLRINARQTPQVSHLPPYRVHHCASVIKQTLSLHTLSRGIPLHDFYVNMIVLVRIGWHNTLG